MKFQNSKETNSNPFPLNNCFYLQNFYFCLLLLDFCSVNCKSVSKCSNFCINLLFIFKINNMNELINWINLELLRRNSQGASNCHICQRNRLKPCWILGKANCKANILYLTEHRFKKFTKARLEINQCSLTGWKLQVHNLWT